jgi:tRNA (guanine-N1)-methyltransferase
VRIDVITIFPEYLDGPLGLSLIGRARELGLVDVRLHDPREHTMDRHRSVDDAPFGGGAGMVMTPEALFATVEATEPPRPLLLLSASGRLFDQARKRARRAPGLLACAVVTARTSGPPTTSVTARSVSATSCSPARPRPRGHRAVTRCRASSA